MIPERIIFVSRGITVSDPALLTTRSHWLINTALWYFSIIINSFPNRPKDSRKFHTSRQHITHTVMLYIPPMPYNHIFHRKEGDTHNHHTVLILTCCQLKFFDPWIQNKQKEKKHKHVNWQVQVTAYNLLTMNLRPVVPNQWPKWNKNGSILKFIHRSWVIFLYLTHNGFIFYNTWQQTRPKA